MRKGHDGLTALVKAAELDEFSGHLFVFISRRGDRAKILSWERGGFVLWYNHLSSHYTSSCSRRDSYVQELLSMLAARSTSRSHRLLCFVGGSGPVLS